MKFWLRFIISNIFTQNIILNLLLLVCHYTWLVTKTMEEVRNGGWIPEKVGMRDSPLTAKTAEFLGQSKTGLGRSNTDNRLSTLPCQLEDSWICGLEDGVRCLVWKDWWLILTYARTGSENLSQEDLHLLGPDLISAEYGSHFREDDDVDYDGRIVDKYRSYDRS